MNRLQTKEWRELREKISGEKNYNWKGGTTSKTQQRIRKAAWLRLSNMIRERDNNTCRRCGIKRISLLIAVHHIIPYRISESNNPFLLISVCNKCHAFLDHEFMRVGVTRFLRKYVLENEILAGIRDENGNIVREGWMEENRIKEGLI